MTMTKPYRLGDSLATHFARGTWRACYRLARMGAANQPPHLLRAANTALVRRHEVDPIVLPLRLVRQGVELRDLGQQLSRLHPVRARVLPLLKACGVPWPICPHCPGQPLTESGGRAWCGFCRRDWPSPDRSPCCEPASVIVHDLAGDETAMCPSHAARALHQVVGLVVVRGTPLDWPRHGVLARGAIFCAAPHGDLWCRRPLLPGETRHLGPHRSGWSSWPAKATS